MLRQLLFGEDYRLQAANLEALAAADVFASHHVVFAEHVGASLGEAGAIAFVGTARKLLFLGADDPGDLVVRGLTAVGAVQICHLLFRAFVEKFSFFHKFVVGRSSLVWNQLLQFCGIQAMA